jgi:hypothetical protein
MGPNGSGVAFPWEGRYREIAGDLLRSPNTKCGHNTWLFDQRVLKAAGAREGLDLNCRGAVHDTPQTFHHWQPDLPAHLQFAASFICFPFPWKHLTATVQPHSPVPPDNWFSSISNCYNRESFYMQHRRFRFCVRPQVPELLTECRDSFRGDDGLNAVLGKYSDCDVLLLDDLGAENSTPFARETLGNLIDRAYQNEQTVIVTSNFDVKTLAQKLDQRTADRPLEICAKTRHGPTVTADLRF